MCEPIWPQIPVINTFFMTVPQCLICCLDCLPVYIMELLLPKFQAQECPDIATEQPPLAPSFSRYRNRGQIGAAARILAPERQE